MHEQKLVRAFANNDHCPRASKQCRFTHWFILMMGIFDVCGIFMSFDY